MEYVSAMSVRTAGLEPAAMETYGNGALQDPDMVPQTGLEPARNMSTGF